MERRPGFNDSAASLSLTSAAYDVAGTNWKLSVADNGIGKRTGGPQGTTVSVTHATFAKMPLVARKGVTQSSVHGHA